MGSLKDALLKAGLSSTKNENHRDSAKGRERKQSEKHQHARNFCEQCNSTQPDVERYKHRNPTTDAEWICVACADRLMIHDQFRVTQQSDFSKRKMFRREYGETLDLSGPMKQEKRPFQKRVDGNKSGKRPPRKKNGPVNGNR